jgi:tetratricopeptide (TPR) repeat protein
MYSPREVAEIVGLQEARVRYWAQTGVVGPSAKKDGRGVYTFQDLVGVKAAKELLDRGLSLQSVRKSLDALRAQLPGVTRPLAELRIQCDGERILVLDEQATFEPVTGQLVMDFQLGPLETRAAQVLELQRPREGRSETAYAWFQQGVQLDDGEHDDQALIAYEKALTADPNLAAAHTNSGNLLHRRGELEAARLRYDKALALDPEQPEARYNLANLLEDMGDSDRAIAEWTRVVTACPEFADAHYNLGTALAREGSAARARVHLEKYLALDPEGDWATRARTLLTSLK